MKIIKEKKVEESFDMTVEQLRLILFEVKNQEMTVRDLRQFLFKLPQGQSATKFLFKAV